MKVFIYTTPFGVFAFNEKLEIIGFKVFEKDEKKVAQKLLEIEKKILKEEKEIIDKFKDFEIVFVNRKEGFQVDTSKESEIKEKLTSFLLEKKIFKNIQEIVSFSSQVLKELAKIRLKEEKRDKIIAHTVQAIEEHEKLINTLVERLREIYSLYFPELEERISDHKKFVSLLSQEPRREKIKGFEELGKKSVGMNFREEDLEMIKKFASEVLNLIKFKDDLESYLEKLMKDVAPNISEIAGVKLGAKLIRAAGSLEKLAKLPSSTIQLLGAEKALFRFLRGKGKPPKHGYIFIHPLIQSAPKKLRGKIARVLASKIMMAARIDYFTKEYKADKLKRDLEERIKEIYESKKA